MQGPDPRGRGRALIGAGEVDPQEAGVGAFGVFAASDFAGAGAAEPPLPLLEVPVPFPPEDPLDDPAEDPSEDDPPASDFADAALSPLLRESLR